VDLAKTQNQLGNLAEQTMFHTYKMGFFSVLVFNLAKSHIDPQNLATSPFIFSQNSFVCMSLHWIGIFWGHQVVRTCQNKGGWFFP